MPHFKFRMCHVLPALFIGVIAAGQEAPAPPELAAQRAPEAAPEPAKLSFRQREHLFGDWGGLRSRLEDKGVTADLVYTGEYLWNFRGGIKRGSNYRADISLTFDIDTEKAGWWDHGQFFIQLQAQHGNGISERFVGDAQVLSNIDADDYFQLSEFWYTHTFLDGKLWIKLGKQEGNTDFAYVENGGEFINSSPGFSPTIFLVTYPDQDWGAVVGIEPVEWFSMNVGVYQGRPNGGQSLHSTINHLYGPLVVVEPSFHYKWHGNPGHLRLGYWWNGDRFDKIAPEEDEGFADTAGWRDLFARVRADGLTTTYLTELAAFSGSYLAGQLAPRFAGITDSKSKTYGYYANWDQQLRKENKDNPDDPQGIGIFAQFGSADDDVISVGRYFGAGVQWTGAIPSRDFDIFGLGVFRVDLSEEESFTKETETAIETYYKALITPWFALKADLQYILNPGGTDNRNALAGGFRAEISF